MYSNIINSIFKINFLGLLKDIRNDHVVPMNTRLQYCFSASALYTKQAGYLE